MTFVRPDWYDDAACAGLPQEWFFPGQGGSSKQGREVCARCPVSTECLDHSINTGEMFGIWGGLTERDRRTERVKRRKEGTLPEPTRRYSDSHQFDMEILKARGEEIPPGPHFKDITGRKYGRLTVIERVDEPGSTSGTTMWLCQCECGEQTTVRRTNLHSTGTQSCGCLWREAVSAG